MQQNIFYWEKLKKDSSRDNKLKLVDALLSDDQVKATEFLNFWEIMVSLQKSIIITSNTATSSATNQGHQYKVPKLKYNKSLTIIDCKMYLAFKYFVRPIK